MTTDSFGFSEVAFSDPSQSRMRGGAYTYDSAGNKVYDEEEQMRRILAQRRIEMMRRQGAGGYLDYTRPQQQPQGQMQGPAPMPQMRMAEGDIPYINPYTPQGPDPMPPAGQYSRLNGDPIMFGWSR